MHNITDIIVSYLLTLANRNDTSPVTVISSFANKCRQCKRSIKPYLHWRHDTQHHNKHDTRHNNTICRVTLMLSVLVFIVMPSTSHKSYLHWRQDTQYNNKHATQHNYTIRRVSFMLNVLIFIVMLSASLKSYLH